MLVPARAGGRTRGGCVFALVAADRCLPLSPAAPASPTRSTGIATAYMDSIPMVIIAVQVPTHAIGQDAFQECDTVGITPLREAQLPGQGRQGPGLNDEKAFFIASTGRPGPVLVDIPKDVTIKQLQVRLPERSGHAQLQPHRQGHSGQIQEAVQLLLDAKRPMIYAGGGVVLNDAARS